MGSASGQGALRQGVGVACHPRRGPTRTAKAGVWLCAGSIEALDTVVVAHRRHKREKLRCEDVCTKRQAKCQTGVLCFLPCRTASALPSEARAPLVSPVGVTFPRPGLSAGKSQTRPAHQLLFEAILACARWVW